MKVLLVSVLALFIVTNVFSQSLSPEVISSSGDYYEAGNVSLSWTLGECVIETYQNSGAILTQGFHQTKLVIVEIDKIESDEFNCIVYPNPTNDFVNIEITGANNIEIIADIFDINGKKIYNKNLENNKGAIDLSGYSSAYYILKLQDRSGKVFGTYKIVKQD